MKLSLSNLGTMEAISRFQETSLDTMNKLGAIIPIFTEFFDGGTPQEADPVDSEQLDPFLASVPCEILLNDGDILKFDRHDDQFGIDSVWAVQTDPNTGTTVREVVLMRQYAHPTDPHGWTFGVGLKSIPCMNGDNWTFEEILDSLVQSYSCNDIAVRATQLALDGEFTSANFAARCGDISGNLYGDSKEFYQLICNNVVSGNVAGLVLILSKSFSSFSRSTVNQNTLDFENNNYFVHSLVGTVVLDSLGTALVFIGVALAKFTYGLSLAISLAGTGLNAVARILSEKTSGECTINKEALDFSYQQPVYQTTMQNVVRTLENSALFDDLLLNRMVRINSAGILIYMWVNDSDITDDTTMNINLECFTNAHVMNYHKNTGTQTYPVDMWTVPCMRSVRDTNFNCHITQTLGNGDRDQCMRTLFDDEAWSECFIPMDMSVNLSDNHAIGRVNEGLCNLFSFLYSDTGDSWVVDTPIDRVISWNQVSDVPTLIAQIYIRSMNLHSPEWQDIVNSIIPRFQAIYNPADRHLLERISRFYTITEIDPDTGATFRTSEKIASITHTFPTKGIGYIIPPNYTKSAFWMSVAIGVLAATVAITVYAVGKIFVRRLTNKIMFKRYAKVQQLSAAAIADPSSANVNTYLKEIRKYNRVAKILGQSTLDPISGWLSDSDASSTSNTVLSKLLYDQNTGTENTLSADINRIRQLIIPD